MDVADTVWRRRVCSYSITANRAAICRDPVGQILLLMTYSSWLTLKLDQGLKCHSNYLIILCVCAVVSLPFKWSAPQTAKLPYMYLWGIRFRSRTGSRNLGYNFFHSFPYISRGMLTQSLGIGHEYLPRLSKPSYITVLSLCVNAHNFGVYTASLNNRTYVVYFKFLIYFKFVFSTKNCM
jgi:hypothetical protein